MRVILKTALMARAHFHSASALILQKETEVTRTNRRRGFILVCVLTMAAVVGGSSAILSALAQDEGTAPDPQVSPRERPWMSDLTDEQKEELQNLMESLKSSGATPQETRDAINAKLQEWGIEVPQVRAHEPPWMSQLTDEQKEQIRQLTESLRESGASPEETREAIDAKLQEWGVEVSALPEDSRQLPPRQPPWMSQLTDAQKEELRNLMESMRSSGATPQETRDAINAKLQEWGIELLAPPESPRQ